MISWSGKQFIFFQPRALLFGGFEGDGNRIPKWKFSFHVPGTHDRQVFSEV